jgi:hypothetical protein
VLELNEIEKTLTQFKREKQATFDETKRRIAGAHNDHVVLFHCSSNPTYLFRHPEVPAEGGPRRMAAGMVRVATLRGSLRSHLRVTNREQA